MGKRHKEAVALLVQLASFALSRVPLFLGSHSVLQDRDVHAAVDDVDYKIAPALDFLGAHLRTDDFLNHAGQNTAENLQLAQQRNHRIAERAPLAAMAGSIFIQIFRLFAVQASDDLVGQSGKMVLELLIVQFVDKGSLLRVTSRREGTTTRRAPA